MGNLITRDNYKSIVTEPIDDDVEDIKIKHKYVMSCGLDEMHRYRMMIKYFVDKIKLTKNDEKAKLLKLFYDYIIDNKITDHVEFQKFKQESLIKLKELLNQKGGTCQYDLKLWVPIAINKIENNSL
jgi:hypothetical protein